MLTGTQLLAKATKQGPSKITQHNSSAAKLNNEVQHHRRINAKWKKDGEQMFYTSKNSGPCR